MKSVVILQEKLEKHKETLNNVDVQIKRITGREQAAGTIIDSKASVLDIGENNENNAVIRRTSLSSSNRNYRRDSFASSNVNNNRNRPLKRHHQTDHNRHSSDESDTADEPQIKHTIQSAVISTQTIIKSKDDLIKLQNKDTGSSQRNKRIFGMILGTLQKFKTEDKEKSETSQAKQRKEIEKKIEVKEQEEKTKIKEERSELFKERHKHQQKIKALEQKLQMCEELETWCKQQSNYRHFIRTQTKPYIYYLPKIMEPKTEKLLGNCAMAIEAEIAKRRADTEKEIDRIVNNDDESQEEVEVGLMVKKDDVENNRQNPIPRLPIIPADSRLGRFKDDKEESSDSDMDEDRVNDVKIGVDDDEDDEEVFTTTTSKPNNEQDDKKDHDNQIEVKICNISDSIKSKSISTNNHTAAAEEDNNQNSV